MCNNFNPRLITRDDVVRKSLEEFLLHFRNRVRSYRRVVPEAESKLITLDPQTVTKSDIDAILGENQWSENRCENCDEDKEVILRLGDSPDYEVRWTDICEDCLMDVLRLFA